MLPDASFIPSSKNKNKHCKNISFVFSKVSFSYISRKATFLYFLQKRYSYILVNGNFLYFLKKTCLIFRGMVLPGPKLKKVE